MTRSSMQILVAVLALTAIVLGYLYYQEQQKTTGVAVEVGEGGISIETK